VVLLRGPFGRLADALERLPGGHLARAALLAVALVALSSIATLPLAFVRGYVIEHAWGLSTQGLAGWSTDRLRSLAVGAVVSAVAAVAFFAVVRWQPRTWWLWGWGAFTLLTAVFVFLWPVVVAPLFNRFTPLDDASLGEDIRALGRRAGVPVDDVLVADASRRTTAENAYVAGLGGTKRIVLYDTLLEAGAERETLYVVGHELGHEAESHVLKGVALSSAGLLVGFALLAWLARSDRVLIEMGARGIGDVRALPALLLFTTVAGLLMLPAESAISRAFERRADALAVALTGDRDAAVRVLRRLGLSNIADLAPPPLAVALLYSHPPIPERIRNVVAQGSGP
jgi:STE24 endopeptidase